MKKLLLTWELIQYGFYCIENAIYFRMTLEDNIDRCAFFEELSRGWFEMYIDDYDDWYNPTISKERKLRLGQI